jgi:hypothetical protein
MCTIQAYANESFISRLTCHTCWWSAIFVSISLIEDPMKGEATLWTMLASASYPEKFILIGMATRLVPAALAIGSAL